MRVDNINWSPVRLRMERVGNQKYTLFRHDKELGTLHWWQGRWEIWYKLGGHTSHRPSFRTASLALARDCIGSTDDRPQNYGKVDMIRINCDGLWYTVLFDRDAMYLYEDFTIDPDPKGTAHTRLRKVLATAERWKEKHL